MDDQQANTDLPQITPQPLSPGDESTARVAVEVATNPVLQNVTGGASQQVSITLPEEASDSELIEKEWVLKAKEVVAHTSDDPYTQQAHISKIKADYMKKRYGKDIKVGEG
jgi:hypothetical protein